MIIDRLQTRAERCWTVHQRKGETGNHGRCAESFTTLSTTTEGHVRNHNDPHWKKNIHPSMEHPNAKALQNVEEVFVYQFGILNGKSEVIPSAFVLDEQG